MADTTLFDNDETAGHQVFTVAQLAAKISQTLKSGFGDNVWVEGEMSSLKRSANGHVYFDLVEPNDSGRPPEAVISVVLLKPKRNIINKTMKASGAGRMDDGVAIRIRGSLDFYGPQGRLQLRMTGIDPEYTIGRMAQDKERILALLRAEHLTELNSSLAMPVQPKTIGLVTSAGSAAAEDFLAELERSGLGWNVKLFDTRVQGPTAVTGLCTSISAAGSNCEIVAVVRGGGARTDLAAFDSEAVARTIAGCPVPVVTGIGHEIDSAIADEVAAVPTKTPTAAAGFIIELVVRTQAKLATDSQRLAKVVTGHLDQSESLIAAMAKRANQAVVSSTRLAHNFIDQLLARLQRSANQQLTTASASIDASHTALSLVNPDNLLTRGWSIARDATGEVIKSHDQVEPGEVVITTTKTGTIESTVESTKPIGDTHP